MASNSLFPAYGSNEGVDVISDADNIDGKFQIPSNNLSVSIAQHEKSEVNPTAETKTKPIYAQRILDKPWLANLSFAVDKTQLANVMHSHNISTCAVSDVADSVPTNKVYAVDDDAIENNNKSNANDYNGKSAKLILLDFDGSEKYYVDKKANQNNNIKGIHRSVRPRYNRSNNFLNDIETGSNFCSWPVQSKSKSFKRYYRCLKPETEITDGQIGNEDSISNEQLYKKLTRKTIKEPENLSNWFDLFEFNKLNINHFSHLVLAQKQLILLENAFKHHPGSETILRLYIDVANSNFPSNEVSDMIEKLLVNDPYNYTLWTAHIMAVQGNMSRCSLTAVLAIFEHCIERIHKMKVYGDSDNIHKIDFDLILLRFFHNCALFLRQTGHYEKFFTLLKFALELNVNNVKFKNFIPEPKDEQQLVEFEEVILKCGLPMGEIWMRIEKLRQSFYFLAIPLSTNNSSDNDAMCSEQYDEWAKHSTENIDPLRFTYQSDVCNFIYPLGTIEHKLYLMLLIVKLVKVPFITSHCLSQRICSHIEQIGDFDDVEMVLASIGHRNNYLQPLHRENKFFQVLHDLAKEVVVSPTFLHHLIGYKLYVRCISDLLVNCASSFSSNKHMRYHNLFILIWFRFERLLLILRKLSGKLDDEYVQNRRTFFKNFLKFGNNRNNTCFFEQLGLFEYEILWDSPNVESSYKIFEKIIMAEKAIENKFADEDFVGLCITYAEILIAHDNRLRAFNILNSLAFGRSVPQNLVYTKSDSLAAIENFKTRISAEITKELEYENQYMDVTGYFIRYKIIVLLKASTLLQYMIGQKEQALKYIQDIMENSFTKNSTNERHRYLREQMYELYIMLLQMPLQPNVIHSNSHSTVVARLSEALSEYPRNLYFLQSWCMLTVLPWYKICERVYCCESNILSILYLIAAVRFRFLQTAKSSNEVFNMPLADCCNLDEIVRKRIASILLPLLPNNKNRTKTEMARHEALRHNALYWRLILRCSSNEQIPFNKCKLYLLNALDDCPWNKALYLDGCTFVPQELIHLQDLLIEKSLRVYSIPDELDILRGN